MDTFLNWLNDELNNRDWSQRELARRAGISNTAVGNVMADYRKPTWDFCAAIAKPLERTPMEVFILAGLLPGPTGEEHLKNKRAEYYAKSLTASEAELLETYRELSEMGRGYAYQIVSGLVEAEKKEFKK